MGIGNKAAYYRRKLEEKGIVDPYLTLFTKDTPGIIYDPNDPNIFKIGREKTDYRTNLKTNYDTDPGRVTKTENYRHCWTNYWGNPECDTRSRTVTDTEKIKKHEKLNKDNKEANEKNKLLNAKNKKEIMLMWMQ